MSGHHEEQVARFHQLDVEGFMVSDGQGAIRCYERDHDLKMLDALGAGDRQAVVLVALGIDGNDCNLARVDYYPGRYAEGAVEVISEAIETLEVLRSQLLVMASTPEAHKNERDAFRFGREAERSGLRDVRP